MKALSLTVLTAILLSSCSLFRKKDPYPVSASPELREQIKIAEHNVSMYKINPQATDKLALAREAIDRAETMLGGDSKNVRYDVLFLKGEVYENTAKSVLAQYRLDKFVPDIKALSADATSAYKAYVASLSDAEKKIHTLNSYNAIQRMQGILNETMVIASNNGDYVNQYNLGKLTMASHGILMPEGKSLYDEENIQSIQFSTAVAALQIGKRKEAKELFTALQNNDYQDPMIYEVLAQMARSDENSEEEIRLLQQGRTLFPDDAGLLFAELNYYLRSGDSKKTLPLIEIALAKEPENVGLLTTAGDVYSQMASRDRKAGETQRSEKHLTKSLGYYEKVLEYNSSDAIAYGGIAALYYNRAADNSMALNKISNDYTREGLAKYNALLKMIKEDFNRALPYFQKVEAREPNNISALIALKQIYSTLEDMEKFEVFKKRLAKVQNGSRNTDSFFNK